MHVSQRDVNFNPAGRDEPPRLNPTNVAATRTLGRWSAYGFWVVLGLGVLVLALGYLALRQAGLFPGANGGAAVVDTGSTGNSASGSGSGYGPTGNTSAGTGATAGTTANSRVSTGSGGVTSGGVPSAGSSTGSGGAAGTNGDTATNAGAGGPNTSAFGP